MPTLSLQRLKRLCTWGLWMIFFGLTITRFILPWRQPFFELGLEGDAQMHLNYVQWARSPDQYTQDDLLVPSRTIARGPSELMWYRTAAHVSKLFPGPQPEALMSYTFSAIMTVVFLLGTWVLTRSLSFPFWLQACALILLSISPIHLEGPYIPAPMGMNLSRNSYALFPWLLLLLTSSASPIKKGLAIGFSGWMYPFVAIHLGTIEVLRRLILRTQRHWRELLVFICAAGVPFSVIILLQLAEHGRALAEGMKDRLPLLLETQRPYFDYGYFVLHWKDHIAFWFVYAFALIGGMYFWRERSKLPKHLTQYLPFYFLPLPFGFFGWFCLRWIPSMFYLQVWRWQIVSCILVIPLLLAVLYQTYQRRQWKWLGAFVLLLLVFLRINAFHYKALFQQVWSSARLTRSEVALFAMTDSLRTSTPNDAIVLAPPEMGSAIRLRGRRAIVVDASDNYLPWFSQAVGGEWWERMQALNMAYASKNPTRLCDVASRYRASVILVPEPWRSDVPSLHDCGYGYCRLSCPT